MTDCCSTIWASKLRIAASEASASACACASAKIPIVDAREDLPCLDRLIVLHQDLADVARHFGRDGGMVRLHIGVVGRFEIPAVGPVVVAEVAARGGAGEQREGENALFD